jgi:hypothetical protein
MPSMTGVMTANWTAGWLFVARAGAFFFAAPGTPHTFANLAERDARLLVLCTPASFERYFDRLGEGKGGEPPPGQAVAVGSPIGASPNNQPGGVR